MITSKKFVKYISHKSTDKSFRGMIVPLIKYKLCMAKVLANTFWQIQVHQKCFHFWKVFLWDVNFSIKYNIFFHWIQIFEQKYYANEESSDPPDLHVNGHVGWFVFIAHDLFKRTERGQAPSLKPFSVANSNTQISKKLNSRQNLLKSHFFPYWW